ncbi:hypothetical protein PUN28_011879 [Cardiocondyla obscurior]|uniref:Uncharacterized protein n=1 Tax=Cardiocondyla obscurior TaxID=286306 RepID=A0AAW2FFT5_9HYME
MSTTRKDEQEKERKQEEDKRKKKEKNREEEEKIRKRQKDKKRREEEEERGRSEKRSRSASNVIKNTLIVFERTPRGVNRTLLKTTKFFTFFFLFLKFFLFLSLSSSRSSRLFRFLSCLFHIKFFKYGEHINREIILFFNNIMLLYIYKYFTLLLCDLRSRVFQA